MVKLTPKPQIKTNRHELHSLLGGSRVESLDMNPQSPATMRSLDEQLLIDLSAYLFAAEGRVSFTDLRSSFPAVDRGKLIDALAELEEQNVINFSARHNALFEKATRVTQSLKPLT